MSRVDIELVPGALAGTIEVGGWRPEGMARQAVEALRFWGMG